MKKTLVMILTVVLAMAMLVGCGAPVESPSSEQSVEPSSESTEQTASPEETTQTPAEEGDFSATLAGKGVKEDGSAYKVGLLHANLESEYVIYLSEYAEFLFKESGAEVLSAQSNMSQDEENGHIDDFIAAGVDVVIMDAVDSNGSTPSVQKLIDEGIPVICTIRTIEGVDYELFVSTSDNVATGQKAMEYAATLAAGADVSMQSVQGYMGASDAYLREEGFENVLADNANITYNATDCNWSATEAEAAVTDAITANSELWGVASHSAAMTPGVYSALRQAGADKKVGEDGHVVWVSIDGAAADLEKIREGYMDATVDQSPLTNAVTCVKGVLDYVFAGEDLAGKQIDVPTTLVTAENVDEAGWWGDYDINETANGVYWAGTEAAWNNAAF